MSHKITNRYDQTSIATEFAELADAYFCKNNYHPVYRLFAFKVLTAISIIVGIALGQYYKNHVSQNYNTLLFLVVFFVVMIFIYSMFEVKNGVLVGEYKHGDSVIKYELTYVPLTNKCSLVETTDDNRRAKEFNYNEFVDESGKILELQFVDLIKNFTNGESVSKSLEN